MNREKKGLFTTDPLEHNVEPEISAYYFKEWQQFEMGYHTHESTEIMYVIEGSCTVELLVGDEASTMELAKGGFILLDGLMPHRLLVPASCRMLNIEFRFVPQHKLFPSMNKLAEGEAALAALFDEPASFLVLKGCEDIYPVLKNLVLELDASGQLLGTMAQLLFAELLIRIARWYFVSETASGSTGPQELYVQQCMDFIHQNYDRQLKIKDIAEALNLHPGYLQRVFKQRTGETIMEVLNTYRMEKAKMLLRQTDIPIADIADYVGIGSRQYFHMMFKKYSGLTPVTYRMMPSDYRQTQFDK